MAACPACPACPVVISTKQPRCVSMFPALSQLPSSSKKDAEEHSDWAVAEVMTWDRVLTRPLAEPNSSEPGECGRSRHAEALR